MPLSSFIEVKINQFLTEMISFIHSPGLWVTLLILVGMGLWNWRKNQELLNLAKSFGGHLTWYSWLSPTFIGEMNGLKFKIWVGMKSHYSTGFLHIFLYKNS